MLYNNVGLEIIFILFFTFYVFFLCLEFFLKRFIGCGEMRLFGFERIYSVRKKVGYSWGEEEEIGFVVVEYRVWGCCGLVF